MATPDRLRIEYDERDAVHSDGFTFPSGEFDDAEPCRFASGTCEIDRLPALDLGLIAQAAFVIRANGLIDDVNALAEELVGYTRAQLIGAPMAHIVSDLKYCDDGARFMPAASGVRVHHQSGRDLPASVLLCPHDRGSVLALVTSLAVVEHARFRETDVATIVHDLKGPLATIALESYMLDEKLGALGHPDLRVAVGRVTHNVEFLDRMVQDLLDSYAIDAGQFAVQRKPTDLRRLLESVIDRAISTRDRGRVFLKAPCMMTLSIDDLRIERVVANFLQNALKYAPRTTGIVVRLDVTSELARVSVIDGGPGMTPAETSYVFDKYRRTTSARAHEGSGLGLYVSKQIIDAHGGRIGVDSVCGIGSRFFFELPLA